jgi:hypothetical protein
MLARILVLASIVLPLACDQGKSGVEKRAEEIAAAASAEREKARAAASQVDPAEEKYKARKKDLEQTVADYKADEARVMAKDPAASPGILRKYFEAGDPGSKLAKDLEAKRQKDGAGGYRIKKAEVAETRLSGTMDDAEVEILEETVAKGSSACLLYAQRWHFDGSKWVQAEQRSVKKVDCP